MKLARVGGVVHTSSSAFRSALVICTLAGAMMGLTGCKGGSGSGFSDSAPDPTTIRGSYLAVLNDETTAAAMNKAAGKAASDQLTVIKLPILDADATVQEWQTSFTRVPVPSAMGNQPGAISANADGSMLFVVSADGSVKNGDAVGQRVLAFSMADPMNPKAPEGASASALEGSGPSAIALSPDGTLLAAACRKSGAELALVSIGDSGFAQTNTWSLSALGLKADEKAWHVAWHPSGRFLALIAPESRSVAFFELYRDAEQIGLAPFGAPVVLADASQVPVFGQFAGSSGNTFLCVSLGAPASAGKGPGADAPTPGAVTSIAFDPMGELVPATENTPEHVQAAHRITGFARTGIAPVGLALHASGQRAVIANTRAVREGLAGGSLSVLALNTDGAIEAWFETGLGSIQGQPDSSVPTSITTDPTGAVVIVALVSKADAGGEGELVFYTLSKHGGTAGEQADTLNRAPYRVGVGKLPHGTVIVR
ncbi:MAG: hypothetical protein IBJ18_08485 [Phycisphaerales bacterium]|nr:hypothetical protein [Phycisphaerales bacterium]